MLQGLRKKTATMNVLLLSACSLMSGVADAEQLTFVGKVTTELPKVTITNSAEPVSDVKQFTLSVSANGGVCAIEADSDPAKQHKSQHTCLITWHDPAGLNAYLRGLQGVSKGSGTHTFKYTLSMFDKDTFIQIGQSEHSVTFAAPVAPDMPSMISQWQIKEDTPDKEHEIYSRNEKHTALVFTGTPRNYNQKIEFGGLSCEIPEKTTTCTIHVNRDFQKVSVTGQDSTNYRATDTYNFFNPASEAIQYVWDFTPPEVSEVHVNADDSKLPKVITDYGDPLVLLHNQAAIVVKSPHIDKPGDWWLPTDPVLDIVPNAKQKVTNQLTINSVPVTFNIGRPVAGSYVARPIAKPVKLGGHLVYVYDFSQVNDGLYDFNFSTLDKNGNGEKKTLPEIPVDRNPPDIQFVVNGRQHQSKAAVNLYSMSDITVAAWGGWPDGSKITTVKINDAPAEFVGGTDLIKRIKSTPLQLGSTNKVEVTAQDKTGNEVVKVLDFLYANAKFSHSSQPVMAAVQRASVNLKHHEGASCIAASSAELAHVFSQAAKGLKRGCTIEWRELPAGLDVSGMKNISGSEIQLASGIIATAGQHSYAFDVIQHDAFGESQKVYEANGTIDVTPTTIPDLTVGNPHIAANFPESYKYSIPKSRPISVPAQIVHAKDAEVVLELRDEQQNIISTRLFVDGRPEHRHTFNLKNDKTPLSLNVMNVRAYYKANPDLYVEKPFNFFVLPSNQVRLSLTHPETAVSGVDIPILAQVGMSGTTGRYYLPEMGEWSIYLAKFDVASQKYMQINQPTKTDAEGKVSMTLPADDLLEAKNNVYAFANLVTPHAEVAQTLKANSLVNVPVLSTTGVSAQLSSEATTAPAPAQFLISLKFESQKDFASAGSITWQQSKDGNEWQVVESAQGQRSSFFQLKQPGEHYVRALITHKLMPDTTQTNVIKLTALAQPVIELSGDTRVLVGAVGQYSVSINQYALENSDGNVEWSLDNGATWEAMSATDQATISKSLDIKARLLINAEQPYYIYDSFTVEQIDPSAFRSLVTISDTKAEVGDEIDLTAVLLGTEGNLSVSRKYHFILPNGSQVEALEAKHVLQVSDFVDGRAKFAFKTWIDGHEMSTAMTKTMYVNHLNYQFPKTDVLVSSQERVMYSSVAIYLTKPSRTELPKRVVFSEDITLPPELQIKRRAEKFLTIEGVKAGVYPITVRFFDNRGNEKEHIRFIEIIEPPEMVLEMNSRLEGQHLRPPIRLVSRLSAKLGASHDRLTSVKWFLNEKELSSDLLSTQRTVITEAGEYVLRAEVESMLGQTSQKSFAFKIEPNKKPYCEPFWEQRDRVITFNANCMDDDGKVARVDVKYFINESIQQTTTMFTVQHMSFMVGRLPTNKPLELTVLDDSGAEVQVTAPWPN